MQQTRVVATKCNWQQSPKILVSDWAPDTLGRRSAARFQLGDYFSPTRLSFSSALSQHAPFGTVSGSISAQQEPEMRPKWPKRGQK